MKTQPGGGLLEMALPLVLMVLVFYFLLIRPQSKRTKEHQSLLKSLKRGDEVVTAAGIYGTIHGLTDTVVTLEVDNDVKIKIDRIQIARVSKGPTSS
ncbi:MAG: preprotein translocase subunit YajC [Deltaproteobacteria bacterium GWA2_38_16]|nr:MAG: preprotein translocase subunit YajC [Deltaproteobacteria bacterium GWA2_38_16]OGQ03527.1 MAG: preprotein translocase subunit YajC [Deltaproteobacteria bacterium RIFCSPHIGHO2_02_FULL_38_15]OGQ30402.1 MAG: preprotein translocase subunit YajC [Deltaproteobacteria bacterium RIFCSPLOWO2_01_FULL_38_9]OGQ61466.1 MAG: preprotein translocase subunit YajC [Deltaproteobacteria bacterium RIFCSPLOWO2_12_FULL_38_8]